MPKNCLFWSPRSLEPTSFLNFDYVPDKQFKRFKVLLVSDPIQWVTIRLWTWKVWQKIWRQNSIVRPYTRMVVISREVKWTEFTSSHSLLFCLDGRGRQSSSVYIAFDLSAESMVRAETLIVFYISSQFYKPRIAPTIPIPNSNWIRYSGTFHCTPLVIEL